MICKAYNTVERRNKYNTEYNMQTYDIKFLNK